MFLDIQFVNSGEHHVVNVGANTTNMSNWGAGDTTGISHEVGHMLGNFDEYYTVNGTAFGAPGSGSGNVMNNPLNPPVWQHFDLVNRAVEELLGRTCRTI